MNCPTCGAPNDVDARFCAECGTPLESQEPAPASRPPALPAYDNDATIYSAPRDFAAEAKTVAVSQSDVVDRLKSEAPPAPASPEPPAAPPAVEPPPAEFWPPASAGTTTPPAAAATGNSKKKMWLMIGVGVVVLAIACCCCSTIVGGVLGNPDTLNSLSGSLKPDVVPFLFG